MHRRRTRWASGFQDMPSHVGCDTPVQSLLDACNSSKETILSLKEELSDLSSAMERLEKVMFAPGIVDLAQVTDSFQRISATKT